jgi:hypothetical protein
MQVQETGLKAAIKGASAFVQESAAKSETAAIEAVARTEAVIADAQAKLNDAKQFGGEIVENLGHAGRTTFNGLVEFNGAIGRYGKDALTDTIEMGRKSIGAKSVNEVLVAYVDFLARRSQAMFASVGELNTIAQAKTAAAWSPLGEQLRKAIKVA